jgi:branched-chain amino acid transport system substrate-binding protein
MYNYLKTPWLRRHMGLLLLGLTSTFCLAQTRSIEVLQILPMSGPLANVGNEISQITQAAFEEHNQSKRGPQLQVKVLDDGNVGDRSVELAKTNSAGVSAYLSCFGSVSCLAQQKVANDLRIPLLGPMAGAAPLRGKGSGAAVALRASAFEEVSAILRYADTAGLNQLVVLIQDDEFGRSYAEELNKFFSSGFPNVKVQRVLLNPQKPDYDAAVKSFLAGKPSAILLLANAVHSTGFLTQWRNTNTGLPFVFNLAGQANDLFANRLKGYVGTAAFVTVVPSPWRQKLAVQKDYQRVAGTRKLNLSYLGFEAYLNARFLIEVAVRGNVKNADDLQRSLNNLPRIDVGGFVFDLNNIKQGQAFTDFSLLRTDGTYSN